MSAVNFDGGFFLSFHVTFVHKRCPNKCTTYWDGNLCLKAKYSQSFGLLGFRLVDLVRGPCIMYGFLFTLAWKL